MNVNKASHQKMERSTTPTEVEFLACRDARVHNIEAKIDNLVEKLSNLS